MDIEVTNSEVTNESQIDVLAPDVIIVDSETLEDLEITVAKREYVITGDNIYIPTYYNDAPEWLKSLIDTVAKVAIDLRDQSLLSQLQALLDALEFVPQNQYYEAIYQLTTEDSILNGKIETLNSTWAELLSQSTATIANIQQTYASKTEAYAIAADVVTTSIQDESTVIGSTVAEIKKSYTNLTTTMASNHDIVTSSLGDFGRDIDANASAITGLTTRITTAEDSITAQAEDITDLGVKINTSGFASEDFSNGFDGWTAARTGSPTAVTTFSGYSSSVITDSTFGKAAQFSFSAVGDDILQKKAVSVSSDSVFKVKATFKVTACTSALPGFTLVGAGLTSTYTTTSDKVSAVVTPTALDVPCIIEATFGYSSAVADVAYNTASKFMRFGFRLNTAATGLVVVLQNVVVEDISHTVSATSSLQNTVEAYVQSADGTTVSEKSAGALGWTSIVKGVAGERDAAPIGACHSGKTYAEALAIAVAAGVRLPTLAEVKAGVGAGTGCGWDSTLVWTSTPAGEGKRWVILGNGTGTPVALDETATANCTFAADVDNSLYSAITGVQSKFAYNSNLIIDGKAYTTGFGLTSTGTSTGTTTIDGKSYPTYDSEFWVNAAKFKFTNTNKTGSVSPFTIDASGTTPQITFNGKVTFSNVTDTTSLYNDISSISESKLAGSGVNLVAPMYSSFMSGILPTTASGNTTGKSIVTGGKIGTYCFQWTTTTNDSYVYFSPSASTYNIAVAPNKKWILSCYMKSSIAGVSVDGFLRASNGTFYGKTSTVSTADTWERKTFNLDLSANSSEAVLVRLDCNATGVTFQVDGIMLEEQVGTSTTASTYVLPYDFSASIQLAQDAADDAQAAADTAQTDADTANSLLTDIASDSKLTPSEKLATKKEWDIIAAEYAGILAQGTAYAISTTSYTSYYNALNTYVTPLLTSLTTTSTIVGTTFRTNFKNYYSAKVTLLNAVATKIDTLAGGYATTALSDAKKAIVTASGLVPSESSTNYNVIDYDDTEKAFVLDGTTDTSFGASFPAFRVDIETNQTFKVSIAYKASVDSTTGTYFRIQEYDAELPNGITHIGGTGGVSVVQPRTRTIQPTGSLNNAAVTTGWQVASFDYVPTSTTKWASVNVYHGAGLGNTKLYIKGLQCTLTTNTSAITAAVTNYTDTVKQALIDGEITDAENNAIIKALDLAPVYNTSYGVISYDPSVSMIKLYSTDTTIGLAYRAQACDANTTYTITVQAQASAAYSTGFYFGVAEYDSDLPSGKTHVGTSGAAVVQTPTRNRWLGVNNGAITTTLDTYSFDYTPTSTAKYFSVCVLNYSGMGTATLWCKPISIANKISTSLTTNNDAFAVAQGFTGYSAMQTAYETLGKTIISGGYINTGLVNANSIVVGSITADRISTYSLTSNNATLANALIKTAHITDANITNAKLASLSVTTAKIANAAITNAKIGNLAVDTLNIQDEAVIVPRNASGSSPLTLIYTPSITHKAAIFMSAEVYKNIYGSSSTKLKVNGNTIFSSSADGSVTTIQLYTFSAGTTYTIEVSSYTTASESTINSSVNLVILGVKK